MAKDKKDRRINSEITGVKEVRLVGDDNFSGVMSLEKAQAKADELGLDLIEINGSSNPPICKIYEYSKFLYEEKKRDKKQQSAPVVKEIQLSANISEHDLDVKVKSAKKFIEEGHKVKVVLKLFGRQLGRREDSKISLLSFIEKMEDVAKPESLPKDEGRNTIVILKKK